ncbi:UNVERIFIED_CONTAM: hypothetical protein Sradi_3481400 [Sesamum radiatum]|uniref:Uncharacterized protein n=1 Tax=Sesamum radiatum TaxID=300843 RepID=A0AAW2QDM2_SESRA
MNSWAIKEGQPPSWKSHLSLRLFSLDSELISETSLIFDCNNAWEAQICDADGARRKQPRHGCNHRLHVMNHKAFRVAQPRYGSDFPLPRSISSEIELEKSSPPPHSPYPLKIGNQGNSGPEL